LTPPGGMSSCVVVGDSGFQVSMVSYRL